APAFDCLRHQRVLLGRHVVEGIGLLCVKHHRAQGDGGKEAREPWSVPVWCSARAGQHWEEIFGEGSLGATYRVFALATEPVASPAVLKAKVWVLASTEEPRGGSVLEPTIHERRDDMAKDERLLRAAHPALAYLCVRDPLRHAHALGQRIFCRRTKPS